MSAVMRMPSSQRFLNSSMMRSFDHDGSMWKGDCGKFLTSPTMPTILYMSSIYREISDSLISHHTLLMVLREEEA